MPQYALATGSNVCLQNVQYALPPKLVYVTSSIALESSLNGTTWTALAGAETTGILAGSVFVRCPTANALVVCKPY